MMDKLLIRKLKLYNPYWYAVRYTGPEQAFKAMGSLLRSYGYRGAYWRQGEFDGYGGWVVRADILEQHSYRFDNFENRVGIAKRTYERLERQEKL